MIVSGELPEPMSLPAEAELSVPAGSALMWIGEIMGGDPSADPALTFTKTTVGDSEVYRFTLTKSRIAQIEIQRSDATVFDGANYASLLKWTATQDVAEVRLGVRVPQGSQIVQSADGATMQPGEPGYSMYAKTLNGVKAGDQLSLAFTYQAAAPASGAPSTSGGSGSLAQVLVVLVAAAAGVGGVVAIRRKMMSAAEDDPRQTPARAKGAPAAKNDNLRGKEKADASGSRIPSPDAQRSSDQPERRSAGSANRNLVTLGVVGAIVVAALAIGNQTTKPQVFGDSVTQTFSQGQPCSTATIALSVPADSDLASIAETLFSALKPLEGMNSATVNLKTSSIEVGFCESKADEGVVRQALAPTGLVSEQPVAPAAATEGAASAASSGAQILTVDTTSGSFSPSELTAKSGSPIEITFGRGTGCMSEVVFPSLQIRQSLEQGPVTIKLPALEPGAYSFACGMDMQHGTLVVQ